VVVVGTPEHAAKNTRSYTGHFLACVLNNQRMAAK